MQTETIDKSQQVTPQIEEEFINTLITIEGLIKAANALKTIFSTTEEALATPAPTTASSYAKFPLQKTT